MSDTEARTTGTVECQDCPETHVAEFHHVAGYDRRVRVFSVVCGDFVEMYTEDVVRFD